MPDVTEQLQAVPLFSELNQRQLKRISRDFRDRRFKAGTSIVRQNEMSGIGFFIITEGEASVLVDDREVAWIGPGKHFGELALISETVRTATVTARTPLRCLEITFWDFRRIAKDNPDIAWKLLQYVTGLLIDERLSRAQAFSVVS
ncbi:MAG TPA: cyclic nucleotide-binding domain-containing protein [Gaiellaceae bacterium]|jgi:cAMP-dependent protein kinase regulator|nr:cyclic nucleotide-binding domain-containing protein [Gaiellaceae bacterium]